MPFHNRFQTFLKIYRSVTGGIAMWLKGGPNSYGVGKAVMQIYTGDPSELGPAEITANAESLGGGDTRLSLELSSPTQSSGFGTSRTHAILQLAAEDNFPFFGGVSDVARLKVNSFYVLSPDTATMANEDTVTRMGRLAGPGILGTSIDYLRVFDGMMLENQPLETFNDETDISTLFAAGGFTQRAGNFTSTVERLDNDRVYISVNMTNATAGVLAVGTTVFAAGVLPAWAFPRTGQNVLLPALGTAIGASAGTGPGCIISPTGAMTTFGFAAPVGANINVSGVYRAVNYWTP